MFSTIVIVIIVAYVLGYSGMIVYDLFIKKEPVEFMPKPKDVEVDISDEARQFKPIMVGKDEPKPQPAETKNSREPGQDELAATGAAAMSQDTNIPKDDETGRIAKSGKKTTKPPSTSNAPVSSEDKEKTTEPKPSDEIGPQATDEEAKQRIAELVRIKRQEKLAEEMALEASISKTKETKTEEPKDTEEISFTQKENGDTPTSTPEVRFIDAESSVSPEVIDANSQLSPRGSEIAKMWMSPKGTQTPKPHKDTPSPKPPKALQPPKQKVFRNDAYIDLEAAIDRVRQQTKMTGAQTAEQVSEEANRATLDEVFMLTKKINSNWERGEQRRALDEGELLAIEKAAKESREAPPQFNIKSKKNSEYP